MKFWNRLRWVATALFVVLLIGSCLGADQTTAHSGSETSNPRPAPSF
jgi:hypothetical protein